MQGVGTWWVMNHASLWEKQSHYKVKIVFGLITKVLNYIWSLKKKSLNNIGSLRLMLEQIHPSKMSRVIYKGNKLVSARYPNDRG